MIRTIVASSTLAPRFFSLQLRRRPTGCAGPDQCVWVEYDVVEPLYALTWAPPVRPSCFWKQGIFGRWKMICP